MVTEFEYDFLKAQLKFEIDGEVYLQTKHYPIERSEVEDDIQYLIDAEREFWESVQVKKEPPLILPEI